MVRRLFFILIALSALSCGKLEMVNMFLPLSGDVNSRVEESLAWNESAGVTTLTVTKDPYRWYVCSDIHIDTAPPARFAEMVAREKADEDAFFYQMLGDILFGKDHLDWVSGIMLDPANDPGFAIVGNHDLYFDGWDAWRAVFHSSTYYYFVQTPVARDLYLMLDSANGTLGERQLEWLEDVLERERPGCRHCFVSVHTNILRTDASQLPSTNFTLEETYRILDIMTRGKVDLMLAGHDHVRDVSRFGEVSYITLDSIKDGADNASYLTLDTGESVSYEFVEF
ncbi:MAG: metallophosphoesterase [Bacteroidales bacterium]|nr:metallophosphoesterase [Bacteroidales bacterium]